VTRWGAGKREGKELRKRDKEHGVKERDKEHGVRKRDKEQGEREG
jgi:hypothetical protein